MIIKIPLINKIILYITDRRNLKLLEKKDNNLAIPFKDTLFEISV